MNNQEWLSFPGLLAFSHEEGLYVSSDIACIHTLIVITDGLPIKKFTDEDTWYLKVDDIIEWHLSEGTYAADAGRTEERLWYGVAATEFKRLKRMFEEDCPEEIVPNRIFSDEFYRQVYAKAEREGNKSGMRNLKKARPDLFPSPKVSAKSSSPRRRVKSENGGEK